MAELGSSWCSYRRYPRQQPAEVSRAELISLAERTLQCWVLNGDDTAGEAVDTMIDQWLQHARPLAGEHVVQARRPEFQMALIVCCTSTSAAGVSTARPTGRPQPPDRMSVFIKCALRSSMRGHFNVDSRTLVSETFRTECRPMLSWIYIAFYKQYVYSQLKWFNEFRVPLWGHVVCCFCFYYYCFIHLLTCLLTYLHCQLPVDLSLDKKYLYTSSLALASAVP